MRPNPHGIEVVFQIDKRGGMFSEWMGTDERHAGLSLSVADLQNPNLPMILRDLIARNM